MITPGRKPGRQRSTGQYVSPQCSDVGPESNSLLRLPRRARRVRLAGAAAGGKDRPGPEGAGKMRAGVARDESPVKKLTGFHLTRFASLLFYGDESESQVKQCGRVGPAGTTVGR